jgi:menaquinone-dependent protoporphyrinogen oxidase
MGSQKVLIAYGSRYGCTEDISYEISKFLKNKGGISTETVNLKEIKKEMLPPLENFDGIILGSGIRIGKWTREAEKFLNYCKKSNRINGIIIGVFISCGYASDEKMYPVARKEFLEQILNRIGIKPDIYEAFGGIFDYSESSKVGFLDKKILTMGARDLNMKIDYNSKNDYRNWDQIEEFTNKFTELLKNKYKMS